MMMFPADLWPAGLLPEGLTPDDASRYEVRSLDALGGDDQLHAALLPGTTAHVYTGVDNSDRRLYVRAYNRRNLPDRDPITSDLRRAAFDGDGQLILPAPDPVSALTLIAGAGGSVVASWTHVRRGSAPAATSFRIYVALDGAAMDLATPTQAVTSAARPTRASLGSYDHGTLVRVSVRPVSAQGAEGPATAEVTILADAQAPSAVTALQLEATPR